MKPWLLYSLLTVVTWGVWGIFSKLASNYAKPRQVLIFQTAGIIVSGLVALVAENSRIEWDVRGFAWSALGGFFACLGFLAFFTALEQGPTSSVVSLSAIYPLVTVVLSIVFLHEKLSTRQSVGIILALVARILLAE